MKPLALDLCCGKGGWTIGLLKAGWDVIGVDIEDMGGYPSHLVFADVREIAKDVQSYFPALKFDLVVASPPCQEFSYSGFPFKIAREKFSQENPPDRSIWRACEAIAKELKAPLVLENVRNARPWMGPSAAHYGSFYLWGDVPVLLHPGRPQKGFGRVKELANPSDPWGGFGGSSYQSRGKRGPLNAKREGYKRMAGSEKYSRGPGANNFIDQEAAQMSSKSSARKEWSAKAAMIPLELSTWIGECFYPRELAATTKGESAGT